MGIQERLKILKPLVNLDKDENDFMRIMILQRRKDNPKLKYSEKQLKVYTFYSWEEFYKQEARIKELCDLNNARAYLRLNTQNAVTVSMLMQKEIIDNIMNNCAWKNEGVWNSVSGKGGSREYFMLDIDYEHLHLVNTIKQDLENHFIQRSIKDNKCNTYPIVENPTKSGIHMITKPFDTRILEPYNKKLSTQGVPIIQIQKDCNTLLYYKDA